VLGIGWAVHDLYWTSGVLVLECAGVGIDWAGHGLCMIRSLAGQVSWSAWDGNVLFWAWSALRLGWKSTGHGHCCAGHRLAWELPGHVLCCAWTLMFMGFLGNVYPAQAVNLAWSGLRRCLTWIELGMGSTGHGVGLAGNGQCSA
jgi:hypothetical protein